ncbi:cytochrome P450 [Mycena capillaripes]|nr:cytochrome P450 [Mycena capillaripes]
MTSILFVQWINNRSRLPLPPGPKKMPLVGNLFDMPATEEWKTYQRWSHDFDSDIIHLNVVGKSIIILSSIEATSDLMMQRSSIYSDRPRLPMLNELMGWDFAMGFMKYGRRWRTQRKIFNTAFSIAASKQFRSQEMVATHGLLRRILENPEGYVTEKLEQMAGELIMSLAYGIKILPSGDPYLRLAIESMHAMSIGGTPGKFLDILPLLKHVPSWLPGAGFKRAAKQWKKVTQRSVQEPFDEAKRKIVTGAAKPSFVSSVLSMDWDDPDYSEDVMRDTAGSIFNAGSHTTVSVLGSFVLAMLMNPEVQRKAQLEIDSVVGGDRLPDFEDKPALPYVGALVKEVLRTKPVTPLGAPHFVAVEDEYRGYRIPAGSIILGNTWAILHDEAVYNEPFSFRPERFLSKIDPASDPAVTFGYGRRVCPGQFMAIDSVWIVVASILAAFSITKAVGEDGNVIEPTYEYFSGLACMPISFKCSFHPRTERSADLVQATRIE